MSNPISSLRILPADLAAAARSASSSRPEAAAGDFLNVLRESMDAVEGAQGAAEKQVAELLSGQGADLHTALIAVEKADLSFQLMMQVRNKIVQAYQQIANMQF